MQTMRAMKRGDWLGVFLALSIVWCGMAQTSPTGSDAAAAPAATPAPPPSAGAKLSAADLEKLVAPIALYPDPLLATVLPASVYPLEIVQAARFVADTNNLAKLDEQPWDQNVKDLARVPDALKKLNEDLNWTIQLGEAFLAQDKDLMDAIQSMRAKAQAAGTLKTSEQQIVVVTNMVVEKTVEQKVVVVTNTIVQIEPASTTTVYVPTYNPYTVYYPPPAYYVNPYPLLTFGAGIAVGAIIANNCDWRYGGCYHGHGNVNINVNNNYNRNNVNNINRNGNNNRAGNTGQKWQPDQNRLNKSGASASTANRDARGWSGGAQAGQRPSTGNVGTRPTTGNAAARPSTQPSGARPTSNFQQPTGSRPSSGGVTQPSVRQPSVQQPSVRQPSVQQPSVNRAGSSPAASSRSSSGGSAFSGVNNGSSARSSSNRGASSRGTSSRGGGGGGRSGGGGGGGRR